MGKPSRQARTLVRLQQQVEQLKQQVPAGRASASDVVPTKDAAPTNGVRRQRTVTTLHSEMFSGPMPPPDLLAKYDQVVPGAAARIIAMAERQSEHRMGLETKAIDGEIARSRLGSHYALVLGLVAIVAGFWLVLTGHDAAGASIVGTVMASGLGVFIYGSRRRSREREKKAEIQKALAKT